VFVRGFGSQILSAMCGGQCGLFLGQPRPTFHSSGYLEIGAFKEVARCLMWIASV
jgi:hypothetical protein